MRRRKYLALSIRFMIVHLFYSGRYSMISTSDAGHQGPGPDSSTLDSSNATSSPRARHDSALLMLPAPLSVNRPMMASTSTVGMSRSSEDNYLSDGASGSNQRLIPNSPPGDYYTDSYDNPPSQRHLAPTSPYDSPTTAARAYSGPATRRVPSPQPYPGVSPSDSGNPFRSLTTSPTGYDESVSGYSVGDSEESGQRGSRGGVRLTDSGPVPVPEGVRRISRNTARRPTAQAPQQNRYSRNSAIFNLPPGAAPPQPYSGSGTGM
jgi:chitin synthase